MKEAERIAFLSNTSFQENTPWPIFPSMRIYILFGTLAYSGRKVYVYISLAELMVLFLFVLTRHCATVRIVLFQKNKQVCVFLPCQNVLSKVYELWWFQ